MNTTDFDQDFKLHYYTKDIEIDRGPDEEVHVSIFEKQGKCNDNSAIVFLHGARGIADYDAYDAEADEIERDDELDQEERRQRAKDRRARGRKYDGYCLSFRENTRYETSASNWRRFSRLMGEEHPKYVVAPTWGDFWLLAADKRGKRKKSTTVNNFNEIVEDALQKVGASEVKALYLLSHSMGGLNAMILMHHQAMHSTGVYEKVFIGDGLLFPGEYRQPLLEELLVTFRPGRVLARILAEMNLYEHEWHTVNPIGENAYLLTRWPPTLLHSNTEGMFRFFPKHNELMRIADSVGKHRIQHLKTATSHAYIDAGALKDFLTNSSFAVGNHECGGPH